MIMKNMVRFQSRSRGVAVVYVTVSLIVIFAVIALATDFGQAVLARSELQTAADAAARAAAMDLGSGPPTARASAANVAGQNTCAGEAVQLDQQADVEFGTWDPSAHTFTLLSGYAESSANAVRVTAQRLATRNTGLPLTFVKFFGISTVDLRARAIATRTAGGGRYGIVGIDWLVISGNGSTDSFDGSAGRYSRNSAGSNGSVASNGDVTLSGSGQVRGDAHPGASRQVYGASAVTGNTSQLSSPLSYPPTDPGTAATVNDNGSIPSQYLTAGGGFSVGSKGTVNLKEGTYYFKDFTLGANATLNVRGPVTIYVTGNMTLGGNTDVTSNLAKDLKIRVLGSGTVTLSGTSELYADVYAPLARVEVTSNADLYGSVIGRTLEITGNGNIHYDESLPSPNQSGSGVTLVR